MLRYAAGVDELDMDMYRSCFADDVEVVGFGADTAWRRCRTTYVRGAGAF